MYVIAKRVYVYRSSDIIRTCLLSLFHSPLPLSLSHPSPSPPLSLPSHLSPLSPYQIPKSFLSPRQKMSSEEMHTSNEIAIRVIHRQRGTDSVWSLNTLAEKVLTMRDMYQRLEEGGTGPLLVSPRGCGQGGCDNKQTCNSTLV